MLKLTFAVLAIAIAGSASAGWRDLRVDASSEAAFEQSLATFKDKLSPARRQVFGDALKEIWLQGTKDAEVEQREYAAAEYYRQVDGLSYEELVTLTDPTGEWARMQYKAAKEAAYMSRYASSRPSNSGSPWRAQPSRPPGGWGTNPASIAQAMQQCSCMSPNGPQGN